MKDFWSSGEFWLALAVAVVIKLRWSERLHWYSALLTIFVAVGSAFVLTNPFLDWRNLDAETYGPAVGALIALTAEHAARKLLTMKIEDWLKLLRGGK